MKAEILFADALEMAAGRWVAVPSSMGKGFLPSFVVCGYQYLRLSITEASFMRSESSFMASAKVEGFKDTSLVFLRLAGYAAFEGTTR